MGVSKALPFYYFYNVNAVGKYGTGREVIAQWAETDPQEKSPRHKDPVPTAVLQTSKSTVCSCDTRIIMPRWAEPRGIR